VLDEEVVAVTGGSGFIGSALIRSTQCRLSLLLRAPHPHTKVPHRAVTGRLETPSSFDEFLRGARVLIHCASYIGSEPSRAHDVNDEGTRNLVRAAKDAGVSRIIYVSTTGVYGSGPFHMASESTPARPSSVASRSRRRAERHVLEAGGLVLRPHLVVGRSDRHVVPSLVRALSLIGGTPRNPPKASVIGVGALASQIWSAVEDDDLTGVLHPHHGDPVSLAHLTDAVLPVGHPLRRVSPVSQNAARTVLRRAGLSHHQVTMLLRDSTFTSRAESRVSPGKMLTRADREWYQGVVTRAVEH